MESFSELNQHIQTFLEQHAKFEEKGNKAAAGRARKALGEVKKLVTVYRKESVEACNKDD
jgi:hypothetical protein